MAIAVECQECQRSYKVDDKLAGKKVKCRNCGALMRVPGEEPAEETEQQCLSCGKNFPRATRVCPHCGYNTYTGEKEALPGEDAEAMRARKNRRWIRRPGSPALEMLDGVAKVALTLALLGGVAVTIVHICLSADGMSVQAVMPMLVVVGAVAVIMAPVSALAVNVTVRKMKFAPREDTYWRVVLCMLLPFSLAMIAGWPGMERWDWVASVGWPLAILLLLYLLRADVVEWLASLLAAGVAGAISLIVVVLAAGVVNDLANGLYADMLPRGPWTGLAKGHSPEPRPVIPSTTPRTMITFGEPATTAASNPAVATATAPHPETMPVAGTGPATTAVAATMRAAPMRLASPFIAEVMDDPAMAEAFAVVAPPAAGDWMLALKNSDNNIEADRWSLNPLEKKEHYSAPNFPKATPQFALSPKGDAVAVLTFLPRRHLEVFVPDNKALNRSVWLDVASNVPEGTTAAALPALLGVSDPGHFYVRWDMNGQSALQMFTAAPGPAGAPTWRSTGIGPVAEESPPVLAPNGRMTAVLGRNILFFAQTDGTTPPRAFPIASDANVQVLGMAFSPDSTQIAVYAAIAGLPTLACYQVRTGEPVFTCLLSQTPLEKEAAVFPHAVLWLAGAQACLVNGNELVATATGKKFGTLGLTGLANAQVVGPSMVALTFKTGEGTHTVLAKVDDAKVRAAQGR